MFDPPTAEQQLVLDLVSQIYLTRGDWPAWSWLEEQLERQDLNGVAVYRSFGLSAAPAFPGIAATPTALYGILPWAPVE
jgi:hypothetical protein